MTRQEHLDWCKKRALEYVDHGDLQNAVASMMSDLRKHPETESSTNGILGQLGLIAAMSNDEREVRRYITGFN